MLGDIERLFSDVLQLDKNTTQYYLLGRVFSYDCMIIMANSVLPYQSITLHGIYNIIKGYTALVIYMEALCKGTPDRF